MSSLRRTAGCSASSGKRGKSQRPAQRSPAAQVVGLAPEQEDLDQPALGVAKDGQRGAVGAQHGAVAVDGSAKRLELAHDPADHGRPIGAERCRTDDGRARGQHSDPAMAAAIFAEDATVEDPIGTPLKAGKAAILEFYTGAMATGAKLVLQGPVRIGGV